MAQPPNSSKRFGDKTLDGILKAFAKQRDATRVVRSRQAPTRSNFLELEQMLGGGMRIAGAMTFDEMFHDAVRRQREEWTARVAAARAREEATHPEFYRGRRANALPWR